MFLNLRSAAFNPPDDQQVHSTLALALPLSSRQAASPVHLRAAGMNLDTTLFATVSSIEENAAYTNPEPELGALARIMPETKPSNNIELQIRGR